MKHRSFFRRLSLPVMLALLISLLPMSALAENLLSVTVVEISGLHAPFAGQYAEAPDVDLLVPTHETYYVEDSVVYWQDSYGTTIDDPYYTFEAGRTYQLRMTFRITNTANYAFSSGVKPTLQGVSSSSYSVRVISSSAECIEAAFSFTVPGSREYAPVRSVTLEGLTQPVAGELPDKSVSQLYGNYSIGNTAWEGTFHNGRFVSGNTYRFLVDIHTFPSYSFDENVTYTLDGKTPASVTVRSPGNYQVAQLEYEYYVSKADEISTIVIESGFGYRGVQPPRAGELIPVINPLVAISLPQYAAYELKSATTAWMHENGKQATESRFFYGKVYCIDLTFRTKSATSWMFVENPDFVIRTLSSSFYTYKVTEYDGNSIKIRLSFRADFSPDAGTSESNPVLCSNFNGLKAALESPSVRYAKLLDVVPSSTESLIPTPGKGNTMMYPIMAYGEKVLILEGDATFTLGSWHWREGDLIPGGLIYNTGTLTVKGDGALRYRAPAVDSYNAVIVNRSRLTIESGTLEGYVYNITGHSYYGCAVYQNNANARLTVNGGSLLTQRLIAGATNQAALVIDKGTAVINDGSFGYFCRNDIQDTGCSGLYIKSSDASVTLNGGQFQNIQFPTTVTLSKYLGSGCSFYRGSQALSSSVSATGIHHPVQVRKTVSSLGVHINAPESGRAPAYEAYVPAGSAQVFGGSSGIVWYDITAGKTLSQTDTFVAGHRYRVTIRLEAGASFLFATNSSGTPTVTTTLNSRSVTPKKISGYSGSSFMEISYDFAACPNTIYHLEVSIQPPFAGVASPTKAVYGSDAYDGFKNGGLDWYDVTEGEFLDPGQKFVDGHQYRLQIWVQAAEGYVFNTDHNLDPDMTATVNGQEIAVNRAYEQAADEVVCLHYDFGILDTYVNTVGILDLEPPQPGFTPDMTAEAQDSQKYEISYLRWTCGSTVLKATDTFVAGKTYQAEIKIVPAKTTGGAALYAFANDVSCSVNHEPVKASTATGTQIILRKSWVCPETVSAAALYGNVISSGEDADPVTLTLKGSNGSYETATTDGSYRFGPVDAGSYTLTVAKENHATRTYTVSVSGSKVLDVQICLMGDVNGDGEVDVADTGRVYAHVKGTSELTDEYAQACADVTGDGELDVADTGRIYAHVKNTNLLW